MNLPPQRPDLDVLLDRALQTGGETDGFDFKETLDFNGNGEHKIKLLKALGSFHNTDNGGHVIIGVTNDRRVVGISPEVAKTYDQTPVQRLAREYFAPPPVVQVRHHEREGKGLVIIEVSPFRDFPCIVKRFEIQGKEKLQEGTFLVRNAAAESALLASEAELRKLCEAIAARRARSIVELIQRGVVGLPFAAAVPRPEPSPFLPLNGVRERADSFWSSLDGAPAYIEVYFGPEQGLALRGASLKEMLPRATIPGRSEFPFLTVQTGEVTTPTSWGWLGVIPFSKEPDPRHHPTYLWLLDRSAAFLYREHLWEDRSGTSSAVGIFQIIQKVILVIRFLDRFTRHLELSEATRFRVGITLNNVKGRFIINDKLRYGGREVGTADERQVRARLEATLAQIRDAREDFALNLVEEVVWQSGRHDWSRQDLVVLLRGAGPYLGPQIAFPDPEELSQ